MVNLLNMKMRFNEKKRAVRAQLERALTAVFSIHFKQLLEKRLVH